LLVSPTLRPPPRATLFPYTTLFRSLRRELREELGIVAGRMRPLIRIHHDYPDFRVLLDVRELESFGGEPQSLEGQALRWLRPEEDRKSTRLNSSHVKISYAVFCLKK